MQLQILLRDVRVTFIEFSKGRLCEGLGGIFNHLNKWMNSYIQ